jgi:hypothetical protein
MEFEKSRKHRITKRRDGLYYWKGSDGKYHCSETKPRSERQLFNKRWGTLGSVYKRYWIWSRLRKEASFGIILNLCKSAPFKCNNRTLTRLLSARCFYTMDVSDTDSTTARKLYGRIELSDLTKASDEVRGEHDAR